MKKVAGWIYRKIRKSVNDEIACHLLDLDTGERLMSCTFWDTPKGSEANGRVQREIEKRWPEYIINHDYDELNDPLGKWIKRGNKWKKISKEGIYIW